MPKIAREWGPLEVKRARHPGNNDRNAMMPVGGVSGLLLQISPSGAKSWLLRTMVGTKRRAIGLGPYPQVSLADARQRAAEAKARIVEGFDPIEERKAARAALTAAQRRGLTFANGMERFLETKLDEFRNEKHKKQWRSTLDRYAIPEIGDMLVQEIATQDILRVLEPIWSSKTETATRLRGRMEAVLNWATVAGHRTGDNPARWKGNLEALLPKPNKVANAKHWPALAASDVTVWWQRVTERDGMAAAALRFQALTAARSGAVRLATWDEIDLGNAIWTIQPGREASKISPHGSPHRVPLSGEAVQILNAVPRDQGQPLVFWASRGGPLSDMSISAVMRRIHESEIKAGRIGFVDQANKKPAVPHGLRSTFRDWAAEAGYPRDMAEIALAHIVGSEVERAYRRTDMVERRRGMMEAWGWFLRGETKENIVPISSVSSL